MTGIRFLRRWGVTPVLLVSALWAAGPAAAQAPPASITLADAVRTTLDKAPVVQLALENVGAQQATARVARGTFDGLFRVDPTFTHREDTLAHAGNLENELVKRGVMLGLARGFGNLTDELTKNINSGRADLPYCPADSGWSVFVATLPGSVLPVPLCKPVTSTLGVQADENASGGGFDVNDIYTRPSGLDPLADFELMRSVAGLLQVQLTAAAGNIRAQSLELLYKFRAITADVATRAALAYDRLGAVPTWQYTNSWTLVGDYTKYLRSGSTFQVQGTWDGRASQYREKPLDPIFGGRDAQNRFPDEDRGLLVAAPDARARRGDGEGSRARGRAQRRGVALHVPADGGRPGARDGGRLLQPGGRSGDAGAEPGVARDAAAHAGEHDQARRCGRGGEQ